MKLQTSRQVAELVHSTPEWICSMYPFCSVFLSFPSTALSPRTNVKHEVYECDVKSGYAPAPVQRSVSGLHCFSVCCCHITIILPPWLTGNLSSVLSFFPCPLILSLSLIPAQSELFVKTPPQDEWIDTQEAHSAFCKHNRSYHRRKKCKQMRSPCKNVLMSDVRETKQDVGSDHLNGDQPQWFLLNPVASVACSDRGSLLHL